VIIDGNNKLIILEHGEHAIVVKELYYTWKNWLTSNTLNLRYPLAFRYVGGDDLGDKRLGLTYFLTNGWKIRPSEEDQKLIVQGNLYSEDKSLPFVKTIGDYNVLISTEVSNIIDILPINMYNNITQISNGGGAQTQTQEVTSDDDNWQVAQ